MFGENNTDGYNFDTVLQYATFPRVKVLATGHEADVQNRKLNEDDDTKPGAKSRKDSNYFLDWLYTKGVRHIIRLSVEDSGDSGQEVHSDQVIQAALARFSIEHLDWQKTDLDPETILHIGSEAQSDGQPLPGGLSNTNSASGSQLKKLTLLWSGSNAALRAWGDQEALPMLPWLQEVEIIRPPSHLVCLIGAQYGIFKLIAVKGPTIIRFGSSKRFKRLSSGSIRTALDRNRYPVVPVGAFPLVIHHLLTIFGSRPSIQSQTAG